MFILNIITKSIYNINTAIELVKEHILIFSISLNINGRSKILETIIAETAISNISKEKIKKRHKNCIIKFVHIDTIFCSNTMAE